MTCILLQYYCSKTSDSESDFGTTVLKKLLTISKISHCVRTAEVLIYKSIYLI